MNSDIGNYLQSIPKVEPLTKKQCKELSDVLSSSDEEKVKKAVETFIHSCLPLVVDRAKKYCSRYSYLKLDIMELISEGNLALFRSAQNYKYDDEHDALFSTYAVVAIDRVFQQYVKDRSIIHLPDGHLPYMRQLSEMEDEQDDVIAQKMGVTKDFVIQLRSNQSTRRMVSLDAPVTLENELSWADILADDKALDPSKETNLLFFKSYVSKYLDKIPEIEQRVLELYFWNLNDFKTIAEKIGKSREPTRQILLKAIRRLRFLMGKDSEIEERLHG